MPVVGSTREVTKRPNGVVARSSEEWGLRVPACDPGEWPVQAAAFRRDARPPAGSGGSSNDAGGTSRRAHRDGDAEPVSDAAERRCDLGYTVELYRDLDARGVVRRSGRYPPVLPIVVHNGPSPWTAPARVSELIASPPASDQTGAELAQLQPAQAFLLLDFATCPSDDGPDDNVVLLQIGFERARSVQELTPLLRALLAVEDEGLRRAMYRWVRLLLDRLHFDLPTLEELQAMGSLDEFRSGLEERARSWTEQWFADGRERGLEQGREQGQRDLLERQAEVKFGAATAARLARLLARVTAPATFAEIGEWLLACGTGDELVSRVEAALSPDAPPER